MQGLIWQWTINEHFLAHRLGDTVFLFHGGLSIGLGE